MSDAASPVSAGLNAGVENATFNAGIESGGANPLE